VIVFLLMLMATVAIIVAFFRPSTDREAEYDLSVFVSDAKANAIRRIEVKDDLLVVLLKDGTDYRTRKERGVGVITTLTEIGVDPSTIEIQVKQPGFSDPLGLFVNFLPMLIFVGLIVWLAGQASRRR
jgi:ATP-dependent Zn protease